MHSGLTARVARTRSRRALPYCVDRPLKASVWVAGDQIIMAIRQQLVGVSPEDALAAEEQSNTTFSNF